MVHHANMLRWFLVEVMGDRADIIASRQVPDALGTKRDDMPPGPGRRSGTLLDCLCRIILWICCALKCCLAWSGTWNRSYVT